MAMKDGLCPECGGRDIYLKGGWFHNIIVAFSPPRTKVLVCGNCGYLAEFIEQGGHFDPVKKNWERLEFAGKPEKKSKAE